MQSSLTNQIIILIMTFFFTSVLGGILATFFQNRTWKHQNRVKLSETERSSATEVFKSISSLMDKRLYRMRQLNWKIRDDSSSMELLEQAINNYREVLFEWNDSLNRNLALTQCYFGKDIRNLLEETIYEKFREIGSFLETAYIEKKASGNAEAFKKQNSNLTELRNDVYRLNVRMIELIQSGEVGVFNPDTKFEGRSVTAFHVDLPFKWN